jgi:predicted nucleic-acid-binding protein
MTGLDTNVLVRYVMQDDAAQSARASALMKSFTVDAPGYVALVTVVEFVWVLGGAYEFGRAEIAQALEALLRTKELVVEQAEIVWKALRVYRGSRADLADCLISRGAEAAGCEHTVTFDRGAAKHAGMQLLG